MSNTCNGTTQQGRPCRQRVAVGGANCGQCKPPADATASDRSENLDGDLPPGWVMEPTGAKTFMPPGDFYLACTDTSPMFGQVLHKSETGVFGEYTQGDDETDSEFFDRLERECDELDHISSLASEKYPASIDQVEWAGSEEVKKTAPIQGLVGAVARTPYGCEETIVEANTGTILHSRHHPKRSGRNLSNFTNPLSIKLRSFVLQRASDDWPPPRNVDELTEMMQRVHLDAYKGSEPSPWSKTDPTKANDIAVLAPSGDIEAFSDQTKYVKVGSYCNGSVQTYRASGVDPNSIRNNLPEGTAVIFG